MGHHRLATPDLDRIFRGESVTGLSEWQLLERYLANRDEVAFEALVARHGPMVLGVCRRMLANQTDVEDAFQATFLVLVRRARHLGPRDAIGPWLYGVANRVAMRARSDAARRNRFEPITPAVAPVVDDRSTTDRELAEILHQELCRLPSKYRHPIVLCYLEGQTHEEAARQLKWPIGTVKGRLARARDLLQSRLVRRGLTPAVGALSLALSPESSAALHRELLQRTVRSSLKLAVGQATSQAVSTSITSLVEGVLTSMVFNTVKWAGAAVLVCGLACTGVGVMARQDAKPKKPPAPSAPEPVANDAAPNTPSPAPPTTNPTANIRSTVDLQEIANLQRELRSAAQLEWRQAFKHYQATNTGLEQAAHASKRLMEAQQESASSPDEKVSAVKSHLERVREIARIQHSDASTGDVPSAQVRVYAAEAELLLAQAKTKGAEKGQEESTDRGNKEGRGQDPKSRQILAKLDEPISMSFSEDTPLEDVLKYIKQATTTRTYTGIPIYIDPLGLQESEKSMTSTIRNMDLEGVPLRRTLELILKQLDLIYFVDDGVLCITSSRSEGTFGPAISEPTPILKQAEKAERGELSLTEMKELIELFKTREQIRKLASGERDEARNLTGLNEQNGEHKQNQAQMNVLLKEMRELIEVLKAEKQTKKGAEVK